MSPPADATRSYGEACNCIDICSGVRCVASSRSAHAPLARDARYGTCCTCAPPNVALGIKTCVGVSVAHPAPCKPYTPMLMGHVFPGSRLHGHSVVAVRSAHVAYTRAWLVGISRVRTCCMQLASINGAPRLGTTRKHTVASKRHRIVFIRRLISRKCT